MGRKKKVVEEQVTNNEKQINNNLSVSEGQKYNGNVSIRLVKNGKTVQTINKHNDGFLPLFDFLINCLASNYNNGIGIPNYIRCGYSSGSGNERTYINLMNNPLLRSSSFISSKSISNSSNVPQINYQFTIPTVMLSQESGAIEDNTILKINTFRLYSYANLSTTVNQSAEVILDKDDTIKVPIIDLQKYTMFITWSLYITN